MIIPTKELAEIIKKELNKPDPELSIAKEILDGRPYGNNSCSNQQAEKEEVRIHGGG